MQIPGSVRSFLFLVFPTENYMRAGHGLVKRRDGVREIGRERIPETPWKLFYCADFVPKFRRFVEFYDPQPSRSVLASKDTNNA